MKRILFKAFAYAAIVTLLSADTAKQSRVGAQQAPEPARSVDVGTIKDSSYVNDYFGMRLTIPESWNVYDSQGRRILLERGRQEITGNDKSIQSGVDASVARTVNLLTVSKLPQNKTGVDNAIFACGAELVTGTAVKTGEDYLTEMKKILPYWKITYEIEKDVGSENINEADFGSMLLKIEKPGGTVRQKYYAITKRDYTVFCISTYMNEDDRQVMDKVIKSIRFR